MATSERRRRRSHFHSEALFYQLDTSRERAQLQAMILADEDGLCVASSGDAELCEEFALHAAMVCNDSSDFEGCVFSPNGRWDIHMQRFDFQGIPLFLCAVGGSDRDRANEIKISMNGVSRILAA